MKEMTEEEIKRLKDNGRRGGIVGKKLLKEINMEIEKKEQRKRRKEYLDIISDIKKLKKSKEDKN